MLRSMLSSITHFLSLRQALGPKDFLLCYLLEVLSFTFKSMIHFEFFFSRVRRSD